MPSKPLLQIQLSFKNLFIFIIFFFLMHEMHELAHIITGRLICGCWGTRDFNVWDVCTGCIQQHPWAISATFAGPVFTFAMLWVGRYWVINGKSIERKSLGLVFILGNMQFGRIYMAATGGGDEVYGFKYLLLNHDHSNLLLIRLTVVAIISIICIPPLITAYKTISNKRKILLFAGFLIIPLILDTIVILIALNGLLQKGVLNHVWILGMPLFITLWFAGCILAVMTGYNSLTHFAQKVDSK